MEDSNSATLFLAETPRRVQRRRATTLNHAVKTKIIGRVVGDVVDLLVLLILICLFLQHMTVTKSKQQTP